MSLITRLLFLALAAGALLIGVQLPNFVDQYGKRLDAHFIEVQTNLKPFQDIADQFHGGSMEALIAKHEQSTDETFHAEGEAIRKMYRRFQRFANEKDQLNVELPWQLAFIATRADRELVDETRRNYSFALLLNRQAVISGLVVMAAVVLLLELLAGIGRALMPGRRTTMAS
jgi:hypothetical protein